MVFHVEFTRIIKRPLHKVFAWCTDFEPEDIRFSENGKSLKVRKKGDIVSLYSESKDGDKYKAKVKLMPPNRWEADYDGDTFTEHIVYTLQRVKGGTKFTYASDVTYKGRYADRSQDEAQTEPEAFWDRVIPALEKEVKP